MFAGYGTLVVCTAKAWDSPRAGTVPFLLPFPFKLAPFQLNYMVLGFAPDWSTCSGLGDSSSDGTMSVATRNANMVTFVDSFG